jgi:hypothetical protein
VTFIAHDAFPTARTSEVKSNNAEGFVIDDCITCKADVLIKQRKALNQEPIQEPDMPMVDFHPFKKQTAGYQHKSGKKN